MWKIAPPYQQGLQILASTGASGAAEMSSSATASRNTSWCHDLVSDSTDSHCISHMRKKKHRNCCIGSDSSSRDPRIQIQNTVQKSSAVKLRSSCFYWEASSLPHNSEHGLCSKAWRSVCPQGCLYLHLIRVRCASLHSTQRYLNLT